MSLESVSGPWEGLYVVAYTTASGSQFHGYSKICSARPDNPWEVDALVKMFTGTFPDETEALVVADLCGQVVVSQVREICAASPWIRRVIKAPVLPQHGLPPGSSGPVYEIDLGPTLPMR
jgi:hypothetical protein